LSNYFGFRPINEYDPNFGSAVNPVQRGKYVGAAVDDYACPHAILVLSLISGPLGFNDYQRRQDDLIRLCGKCRWGRCRCQDLRHRILHLRYGELIRIGIDRAI
jgi:hypothetical protein